jgi:phage protein D
MGLRPEVMDTRTPLEYVLQHNQTDLDFIRGRAQRLGYEITVEDRTLYFRPPRLDASATATLSLGEDLAEFSPRLSTMNQVGRMEVRGWDPKEKRPIIGQARTGGESTMGGSVSGPKAGDLAGGKASRVDVQRPVRTRAEADHLAQVDFAGMALSFVQGDGVCSGARPGLRAGSVIRIAGAGRRFSGFYYVTSVTHTLTAEQYSTAFTVKRTAT